MTTREAKDYVHHRLDAHYGPAAVESIWLVLMEDIMGWRAVDAVLYAEAELPEFMPRKLDEIATRLLNDEPLQLVMGSTVFHGHRFKVTRHTLIPRPETQQLVDMIIDENPFADLRVLDIGTGSGCIAVSLARGLKFASVTATDVSLEALAVAEENARALKARVRFEHCDILAAATPRQSSLDIIVSNPPYVTESEKASMMPNVLNYEPAEALFVPNDDPLLFYRAIARYAEAALTPHGKLYVELNQHYGDATCELLRQYGFVAELRLDYKGNIRFAAAKRTPR